MAGNGPMPSAQVQRPRDARRRDRDVVTVTRDGRVRGPRLPADHGFDPRTVAYYETWRRSPQAQVFESTDWLALQLILPLYDGNLKKPSAAAVSEIRLTTAALGGTYADRLRVAKLNIERPADTTGADATVTPIRAAKQGLRQRMKAPTATALPAEVDDDPAPF